MKTDISIYKTAFENQVNALNGSLNEAFKEKKKNALEDFEKTGLPSSKVESWKYSNLAAWTKGNFTPVEDIPVSNPKIQSPVLGMKKVNLIVLSNGNINQEASKIIDQNLILSSVQEELKSSEGKAFIEKYIDSIENHETEPLHLLNTAFLKDALFLKIKAGKIIEHPVVIVHHFDAIPENGIVQNRSIIDVGENAQVKFAEYFESKNAATFLYNDLQEIFVNASARVEWYRLENENCPGIHVQSQKVKQEKNSYFKSWSFIKDVQKLRNNTYVQLTGPFAETNIYGLSFQNGKSHADNHILVDHAVEDCQSNQLFKGTYNDNSTAVFNGKVLVRKDAQRTNAFQSNKNLLLSEKATINSKPELEIYADDVKCSHGATTGQMNEDQLFYLQARGIEKEKAKAILNQAFLSEVLDYISIPELKNHLKDYFNQCFETA